MRSVITFCKQKVNSQFQEHNEIKWPQNITELFLNKGYYRKILFHKETGIIKLFIDMNKKNKQKKRTSFKIFTFAIINTRKFVNNTHKSITTTVY